MLLRNFLKVGKEEGRYWINVMRILNFIFDDVDLLVKFCVRGLQEVDVMVSIKKVLYSGFVYMSKFRKFDLKKCE